MPTEGRVYQDGLDLVFSPTEAGDSGIYTCIAQNKAGRRTQEVTFTVASESEMKLIIMCFIDFHSHGRVERTQPIDQR